MQHSVCPTPLLGVLLKRSVPMAVLRLVLRLVLRRQQVTVVRQVRILQVGLRVVPQMAVAVPAVRQCQL
jgi:hypothetical protein